MPHHMKANFCQPLQNKTSEQALQKRQTYDLPLLNLSTSTSRAIIKTFKGNTVTVKQGWGGLMKVKQSPKLTVELKQWQLLRYTVYRFTRSSRNCGWTCSWWLTMILEDFKKIFLYCIKLLSPSREKVKPFNFSFKPCTLEKYLNIVINCLTQSHYHKMGSPAAWSLSQTL